MRLLVSWTWREFSKRTRRRVHTIVLIRHGESIWNSENRFTGWSDVPLTSSGEMDAKDAGNLIGERGLKFDVAFTSNLERAWRTCAIVLATSGQGTVQTHRSWLLNERHYGGKRNSIQLQLQRTYCKAIALQGHVKTSPKLLEVFGEDKMHELRRSFRACPPSMYDIDFLKLIGPDSLDTCTRWMNPRYIDHDLYDSTKQQLLAATKRSFGSHELPRNHAQNIFRFPAAESLLLCQERAYSYWESVIAPRVQAGERVLIVAHANTIRALVKVIDDIEDDKIAHLKIPNGVPLVYTLDENLRPTDLTDDIGFQANYLVSARNHNKVII